MGGYDVVVDGTDNFETRYLTNDACYFLKKPNVYGSIFRFEGQASVFWPDRGPCYRCLYPEPPPPGLVPSCAEGGVLGILPGVVGGIQATEAIKILLGIGEPLVGRLLLYDALAMSFEELKLRRDPSCPLCGEAPTIRELQDYPAFCGTGRGEDEGPVEEITARELKRRMESGESLEHRRRPRTARVGDLPDRGSPPPAPGHAGRAAPRVRFLAHVRPALQVRGALGEGGGAPQERRVPTSPEPAGRSAGLGPRGGPVDADLLKVLLIPAVSGGLR